MTFWVLVFSYWLHLLATVIWLGGLALMVVVAWPALRRGTLNDNQWWELQKRFLPWANGSLLVLLLTGFVQMTNDPNYDGFLVIQSVWAQALLIKHLAFGGMVVVAAAMQGWLYPAMARTRLLAGKRPSAAGERERLARRERRLLQINVALAATVLFFTAVATAV